MSTNLRKRIELLEKYYRGSEPLRLEMPDGKIEIIQLPGRDGLWKFYGEVIQGKRPREAELLRTCVSYNEPGAGQLVNLLHVLVSGAEMERKYTPEELARLDGSE